MNKRVLYAADARWAAMAERLDVLMADSGFRALKDEARTRAGLLKGPDGAWVFVKRVRSGSWARGLIVAARGSRVRRWLQGAAMLSTAGFNRPAPLAALEVRRAGAVSESYLVCEALNDATVLSGAVLDGGRVHFRSRRSLLSAVAREVRRLHDAGLYTLDLQETNLMVQERDGAPPRISFVDLEDFRRVRSVSWHRRLLNLVHLDRSIGRFLNRPARLRCLYDYLDAGTLERNERRRTVQQLWQLRDGLENRRHARAPRLAPAAGAIRKSRAWHRAGRHGPVCAATRPLTTQTSTGHRVAMAFSIRRREYDHHTEQVHAAGGASLRDLMLGLNDGLVASFAVTSGVAGAFTSGNIVVMAGLAEMLGGAVSMGLAAFISARSQIEFYHSEIQRERDEIQRWPEREREEIRTIYRAKGFGGELLDLIVRHITADPERWSDVMMREELGMAVESFDQPLRSAVTVGLSYFAGATVPVLGYLFVPPHEGLIVSVIATVATLFVVGAAKTIITTRPWWRSGLESMATGIVAAAVTYGAGRYFAGR